jgi:hypothetical protein
MLSALFISSRFQIRHLWMAAQSHIALQQKLTISGTQAITPLSERSALQCSKPPETRSAEDGG